MHILIYEEKVLKTYGVKRQLSDNILTLVLPLYQARKNSNV